MTKKDSSKSFGIGMMVGLLAGASAYYFYGTKKGRELTQKIKDEYEHQKSLHPVTLKTVKPSQLESKDTLPAAKSPLSERLLRLAQSVVSKEEKADKSDKSKRLFRMKKAKKK